MANPQLMSGLGAVLAMFLSALGAAWASIPAGNFAVHADGKNIVMAFGPIVISGVLAIYGTIVAVLLVYNSSSGGSGDANGMTDADGYRHLSAGLMVGLACLASGFGLHGFLHSNLAYKTKGAAVGTNSTANEPLQEPLLDSRLASADEQATTSIVAPNVRFLMVLVFLEAIALYGLIVAIYMAVVRSENRYE